MTFLQQGTESLAAHAEYVGTSGTGTYTQAGGANFISDWSGGLFVGYNAGSNGTYNLSGTATLHAAHESIGDSGTGFFNQSGGTHTAGMLTVGDHSGSVGTYTQTDGTNKPGELVLGQEGGSTGTYNLNEGVLSATFMEMVGRDGTGTFTQIGGTNATDWLSVGFESGTGTYSLSGTGILSTREEVIGGFGSGTFNQNGGTNTATLALTVGSGSGGASTYHLSDGTLQVLSADSAQGREDIGYHGTGTLTQDGGTNTTKWLTIGLESGGEGAYHLNDGDLHVLDAEYIGYRGIGIFNQTGGTNVLDGGLGVASQADSMGQYNLSGTGVLQVGGSESIATGGMGVFTQTGDTTHSVRNQLHVGGNAGSTGIYTQNGGTTTVKNQLRLANNPGSTGRYELNGGSLLVGGGSGLEVIGAGGAGTFVQTGGTHTVTNELVVGGGPDSTGLYELSGMGILSANVEVIGNYGAGHFDQTDGTNTTDALVLGDLPGSTGTYNLEGGSLSATNQELVGNEGTGTFTQTGGTNSTNWLSIGNNVGGTGTYTLDDGDLAANQQDVGSRGTGTFNQNGGTNTATEILRVGTGSGSTGTYTQTGGTNTITDGGLILGAGSGSVGTYGLSGTGSLSTKWQDIGGGEGGIGIFNQSGGTNTTNLLYISVGGGTGTYELSGTGSLSVMQEYVDGWGGGTGVFNQAGGTNTTHGLSLGPRAGGAGAYHLSNTGVLNAAWVNVGDWGNGTFNQSGGTSSIAGTLTIRGNPTGTGVYNLGGGTLNAANIVNNDQFNYSGGNLNSNVTNNTGATFAISGAGTRTVNGSVTNDGTVKVAGATDGTTVQFMGTFTNNGTLDSDPARLEFHGDFIVGPDGSIHASAGDQYVLYQDFLINSTSTTGWTTAEADLIFSGAGPHLFSFDGLDLTWNQLLLEQDVVLNFTGAGSFTVSVLDGLIIDPDGIVANLSGPAGFSLLYNPYLNPDLSGVYALAGGGSLSPNVIPVPAAVLLELVGLMGLTALRRRLK